VVCHCQTLFLRENYCGVPWYDIFYYSIERYTENSPSFIKKFNVVIFRHMACTGNVLSKAMQCGGNLPYSCGVPVTPVFCRLITEILKDNRLVVICHTKPDIAILVPKLDAMATTLRPSISALSSSDRLTSKDHPYNQTPCR